MGMDGLCWGLVCGVVCGGVWVGGVVYELGEAEGIYAILPIYRILGVVVLYFASRMG